MLDFYTPAGYHVRVYARDSIYVSDGNESVVAIYTPKHGDLIYTHPIPAMTVSRREALKDAKRRVFNHDQVEQD